MGVNNLPKTVTRHRRGCDLNPGPTAPAYYCTLTTRLYRYDRDHSGSCRRFSLGPRQMLMLTVAELEVRASGESEAGVWGLCTQRVWMGQSPR